MLLLHEHRKKNSCITYYEPCLNKVFASAMWSSAHTVYLNTEILIKESLSIFVGAHESFL